MERGFGLGRAAAAIGLGPHPGGLHAFGQLADGGRRIDVLNGKPRQRRVLARQRHHPRCAQRVAAQILEEVVSDRDLGRGEYLGPDAVDQRLHRRGRGLDLAGFQHQILRTLQSLAVHLAGNQAGQGLDHLKGARVHIGGQAGLEVFAQALNVGSLPGLGGQESDQKIRPVRFGEQGRDRLGNGRVLHQDRLDLAQLHPIAAYLHLGVDPAQKLNVAIAVQAHKVAGAIGEFRLAGGAVKRRGDELFRRQFRPVQIASADARPGDEEFALQPWRDGLALVVNNRAPVAGKGTAYGHRRVQGQLLPGARNRCFCRAIGVQHPPTRPHPATRQFRRAGLAPDIEHAQGRNILFHHRQKRGHRRPEGHPLAGQGGAQIRPRLGQTFRADHQFGPGGEGRPHLLNRDIKGEGGAGIGPVFAGDAQNGRIGAALETDVPMTDDRALGASGGTRRIDQIGRVIRRRAGHLARQGQRLARGYVAKISLNIQDPCARRAKGRRPVGAGDDNGGLALGGYIVGPVLGKAPIHGHIGGARLQNPQKAHILVKAPRQADDHPVAPAHAQPAQMVSEAGGALAQFRIAQMGLSRAFRIGLDEAHGDAFRKTPGGLGEKFVQQFVPLIGRAGIGFGRREDQVHRGRAFFGACRFA